MVESGFIQATDVFSATGIFEVILPFLLVFGIMYAILSKTKITGEKADLNAVISLVIAFIAILNPGFRTYVMAFIPYLIVLLVILFVGMLLFLLYGGTEQAFMNVVKKPTFYISIFVIVLILVFMVASEVFTEELQPPDVYTESGELNRTVLDDPSRRASIIFGNPRVVGAIALLVLMALSVFAVTYQRKT